VVDDDAHIREVARFALARAGYTVELACDGALAVERVHRGGIDLVVLDVLMPELDGFAVCRQLQGRVPIVFLSSRGDEADRVRARSRLKAYKDLGFQPTMFDGKQ
jgi:two-component system OmpR family response regulator